MNDTDIARAAERIRTAISTAFLSLSILLFSSLAGAAEFTSVSHKLFVNSAGDIYLQAQDRVILIHGDIAVPILIDPSDSSYYLERDSGQTHGYKAAVTYDEVTAPLDVSSYTEYSGLESFSYNGGNDLFIPDSGAMPHSLVLNDSNAALIASNVSYTGGYIIADAPSPVLGDETLVTAAEIAAIDTTGTIEGNFNVSSSGAATYNIPIMVPEGTAGVSPKLSLNYSSSGGNGIAGLGWNIGSLSAVSRCQQTLQQDGQSLPIQWNADDRFCLDGQRLLLDTGTNYGDVGSTYRTEIDSFVTVTASGGSAGDPSYFKVERKDGSVSYYGNTTDSSVDGTNSKTRTWAINQFEDNVGNKIVYSYIDSPQGDGHMINEIRYAYGSSSSVYNARIKFNYDNRSDDRVRYVAGELFNSKKRLLNIEVFNKEGGTEYELRQYNLNYDESAYGASTSEDVLSRLSSIQECSGSNCLPKTTFDWEVAEGGLAASGPSNSISPSLSAVPMQGAKSYVFADIDGDGIKDLVYRASGSVHYKLARRVSGSEHKFEFVDGLFSDGTTSVSVPSYQWSLRVIDYNGDGHMDIVHNYTDAYTGGAIMYIRLNAPHSDGTWRLTGGAYSTLPSIGTSGIFADMNGDGLTDILGRYHSHLYQDHQSAILDLESNGSAVTSPTPFTFSAWGSKTERYTENGVVKANKRRMSTYGVGDFNGDGIADPVSSINETYSCYTPGWLCLGGPTVAFMSYPSASSSHAYQYDYVSTLTASSGTEGKVLTADFNRDGLTDLTHCLSAAGNWLLQFSTGVGFTTYTDTGVPCGYNENSTIDFNGDGYADMYWHDTSANRYKLKLWDPATNAFESSIQTIQINGSDFNTTGYYLHSSFVDLDGDGRLEFIRAGTTSATVFSDLDADTPKDKIVEITNGLGATTEITYERMGETDHYATVQYKSSPSNSWRDSNSVSSVNALYTAINEDYDNRDTLITNEVYAEKHSAPVISGPSLVTQVDQSMPTEANASATSSMSYYYGDALRGTGGSGIGGFGKRMVVDNQSGIETETTYRQDWPYNGRPIRTEVRTSSGALVNKQESTWTLRTQGSAYSSGWQATVEANGTAALGPVAPYLSQSVEKTYDPYDGTSVALSTVVTDAVRDGYGNPDLVTVKTYTGDQTSSYLTQVVTDNKYYTTGSNLGLTYIQEMGRVRESVVTTTRTDISDTSVLKTTFDYCDTGASGPSGGVMGGSYTCHKGMLSSESVYLDSSVLTTTEHYYDARGNRVMSRTDGSGESRYSPLATYESTGRYVDTVHDVFANGSGSATKQLISDVIARNNYGQPSEARSYADGNSYITSKNYITPRGISYFSTDSTGAWSASTMATGAGSYCPSTAKYYNRIRTAGGGEAYECFDILGRSIAKAAKAFDGTYAYTKTFYDDTGRVVKVSEPSNDLTPNYWTVNTYDDLGRVTKVAGPEAGVDTDYQYLGLETRTTNDLGHLKREVRNALGEITNVYEGGSGATMSNSSYQYDADGNLTKLTDAANYFTTISYDSLGRKTSMDDMDKGYWQYQYNAFGELTCQLDANGQVIKTSYDFKGRMIDRTDYSSGSCASPGTDVGYSAWEYDQASNGWGQLNDVAQFSSTTDTTPDYLNTMYYDGFGRVEKTLTEIDGNTDDHWTKTTYDQYGRVFQSFDAARDSNSYSDNGVQNHYNSYGYLNKITDVRYSGSSPLSTYYQIQTMDDRGNVTQAKYGNLIDVYANYEADTGFLDWLSAKSGGVAYQNYDLTWDDIGNLTKRSNLDGANGGSGSSIANETETYLYDGLNRLTSYSVNGSTKTVAYNSIGNITSKSDFGGSYTYSNTTKASLCTSSHAVQGPHAVTNANSSDYCYDANGNMVKDSNRDLVYSVFDKVTQITEGSHVTNFDYGPSRDRYRRTDTTGSGTRTTLYLGSVEKVYDEDGTTIEWKRNIAGVGQITQVVNSSGSIQSESASYFVKDHLGSITNILTVSGSSVTEEQMAFDPWGARRDPGNLGSASSVDYSVLGSGTGPITTRGFTGHEMLDDVDIIHMNGRIYDARMARFVQADPIVQAPYSTASLNRYSYVWNNPMNATDPSGYTRSQGPDIYVNPRPTDPNNPSIDIGDWENNYAYRYDTLMSDYEQGAWEDSYSKSVYDGYGWYSDVSATSIDSLLQSPSTSISIKNAFDDGTNSTITAGKFASGLAEVLAVVGAARERTDFKRGLAQRMAKTDAWRDRDNVLSGCNGQMCQENLPYRAHGLSGREQLQILADGLNNTSSGATYGAVGCILISAGSCAIPAGIISFGSGAAGTLLQIGLDVTGQKASFETVDQAFATGLGLAVEHSVDAAFRRVPLAGGVGDRFGSDLGTAVSGLLTTADLYDDRNDE